MNTRQILTSAIAAVTVAGTIGIAFAQTSTDTATSPQTGTMSTPTAPAQDSSMTPNTMPPAADTGKPAPMPAATTDSSSGTPASATEPAPKPDRN